MNGRSIAFVISKRFFTVRHLFHLSINPTEAGGKKAVARIRFLTVPPYSRSLASRPYLQLCALSDPLSENFPVKPLLSVLSLLALTLSIQASPVPADWIQPPITVVSENVNVSVGEKMALVVGRYWYQYVKHFDDGSSARLPIYFAAAVPSSLTDFRELLETTQIKLMLGQREFRPESARLLNDEETGAVPTLPHGTAIAWFTFQIPRELAELRFDVVISHFQPHYVYEGKPVATYYPWLPNLWPLRQEMELLDKNFVVTFEALPGVSFALLTKNNSAGVSTPQRLELHPAHQEIMAVAVASLPPSEKADATTPKK